MLVSAYQTKWRHKPGDHNVSFHRQVNLKSYSSKSHSILSCCEQILSYGLSMFPFQVWMYSDLGRFTFHCSVSAETFLTCIQEATCLNLAQKTSYHRSRSWSSRSSQANYAIRHQMWPQPLPLHAFRFIHRGSNIWRHTVRVTTQINAAAFWKIPSFRPFVLLVRATCRWRRVWSTGGPTMTGENWAAGR